ncbi:bifunctional phosphoribosyl-AMP cyclohydrolase/phosphoribosyl-ATP diphosphatase HisIE [Membranihabitans marinus]|uniref:bifunctional phosphoribosyl-AMP cyclohydrolase/phosphoribosyl-ATP diphosphatase HisIE n=1 Tax=Membranihabitans marinus TaxID=1227546 RepID=UPI001F012A5A|nr:bifunctional phosphoribosyl-AMP cyclohydrolase/phosphoribosyl-ATP diphosphatase HisIE [Membranihabitans marinus]
MKEISKENIADIDFDKGEGLVPAIVEDSVTQETLMLGYMNAGAVLETFESGRVTFYSRSKNRLWTKGETSGNFLHFSKMYMDCDNDTLLLRVRPQGPVCHTGTSTCFDLDPEAKVFNLSVLEDIVLDRKQNPKEGSYTNHLFSKGINKIAQKVGEEAVELVIEAKDDNRDLFLGEAADLLYHFTVLLAEKNIPLGEVYDLLGQRHHQK